MLQTINNNIKVSHRDMRLLSQHFCVIFINICDIFQFKNITSRWFSLTKVHVAGVVLFKCTKASITNIVAERKNIVNI